MYGDAVWVSGDSIFGLGQSVDGLTLATPLGAAATSGAVPEFSWDMVTGLIPGSIGETSVIAIALGAILLLWTGIAKNKNARVIKATLNTFIPVPPNTSLAKITENAVATARIHSGQSTGTIIGIKIPETRKPS